jgi:hypothetical protein
MLSGNYVVGLMAGTGNKDVLITCAVRPLLGVLISDKDG